MGSPIVRALLASDRYALPEGTLDGEKKVGFCIQSGLQEGV